MKDQQPARPTREPGLHVWVCTFEHRDGIDVWACQSEDIAYRELARVCREFWDEAREVDAGLVPREGEGSLPADPPPEDRAAVELYFTAMNDDDPPESFLIAPHEVIGREGSER